MAEDSNGKVISFPKNEKKEKKNKKKTVIWLCILIAIVIAAVLLTVLLIRRHRKKNAVCTRPDVKTIEYAVAEGDRDFAVLGNTIVFFTDDSVTGLSTDGTWKWNYEAVFDKPSVYVCGEYAIVSDSGSNVLLFFREDGSVKRETTEGKTVNVACSGNNAAVTFAGEDGTYGVSLYNTLNENMLVFTRRYTSAYLISSAISAGNTFICVSGMEKNTDSAASALSFIKEKDGEAYATVITEDILYPLICTAGDTVFAANTECLRMIKRMPSSTTGSDKDSVIWEKGSSAQYLVSIASSGKKIAAVTENINSSSQESTVTFYDETGRKISSDSPEAKITSVVYGQGTFAAFSEDTVIVYNAEGKKTGTYATSAGIDNVCAVSAGKLAIMTNNGLIIADFSVK